MRVALVTGASGAVGPALVEELLANGYQVRTYSRGGGSGGVPPDVSALAGDLDDREKLGDAVRGADVVFHLAALLHVSNPGPDLRAEYQRVNVEGTRAVMDAASLHEVERVVFFSTIAVYGPTRGKYLDETSKPGPESAYANAKHAAESLVLERFTGGGVPLGTVLRLAAVYGPHLKGNYHRLVHAIARRRFIRIGQGTNRRTLIFERDVARAALLAATHPAAAGRIYNVTDGRTHRVREIEDAIAHALEKRPSRFGIPLALARLIMRSIDLAIRLAGRKPFGVATLEKYLEDVAVRGDLIQQELNFVPEYSLIDGWGETVTAMGLKSR